MRRFHLGLALILSTTSAAVWADAPQSRWRDAYVPDGAPRTCLTLRSIRSTTVRDDRTIDFFTTGGRVYRNILPASCPQLAFEKRFSYRTSIAQLCSIDIITVLVNVGPSLQRAAACGLGQFQPMKRVAK